MSRYLQWSRREHRSSTRTAVILLLGPVFLGLLPALVAAAGPRLDRKLGRQPIRAGSAGRLLGWSMAVAGFSLGVWSVEAQVDRGRGTPLPVMPTQELLTDGPFRHCRNPMTLGAILAYLGIAITAGTTAGIGVVLASGAFLVAYLKRVEEPELAERFGEPYLTYKRTTPFIVPRLLPRAHRAWGSVFEMGG